MRFCGENQSQLQRASVLQAWQVLGTRVLGILQGEEGVAALTALTRNPRACLEPLALPGIVHGVFNRGHVRRRIGPIEKPVLDARLGRSSRAPQANAYFPDVALLGPLEAVNVAPICGFFGPPAGTPRRFVVKHGLENVSIGHTATPGKGRDIQLRRRGRSRRAEHERSNPDEYQAETSQIHTPHPARLSGRIGTQFRSQARRTRPRLVLNLRTAARPTAHRQVSPTRSEGTRNDTTNLRYPAQQRAQRQHPRRRNDLWDPGPARAESHAPLKSHGSAGRQNHTGFCPSAGLTRTGPAKPGLCR
jgi:hypothetical protein